MCLAWRRSLYYLGVYTQIHVVSFLYIVRTLFAYVSLFYLLTSLSFAFPLWYSYSYLVLSVLLLLLLLLFLLLFSILLLLLLLLHLIYRLLVFFLFSSSIASSVSRIEEGAGNKGEQSPQLIPYHEGGEGGNGGLMNHRTCRCHSRVNDLPEGGLEVILTKTHDLPGDDVLLLNTHTELREVRLCNVFRSRDNND